MKAAPCVLAAALLAAGALGGAVPASHSPAVVVQLEPFVLQARAAEGDALRGAVALAHAASRAQGALAGGAWVAEVQGDVGPPSAEVGALLARHGVRRGPDEAAAVGGLDALPEPARGALARVVHAFLAFDAAARAATPTLPGLATALPARAALLDAGLALRDALAAAPVDVPPLLLAPALAFDLAGTDSAHVVDVALLIDAGGDDLYLNNAGGSNLFGGACLALVPAPHPTGAAAALDFGGSDRYLGAYDCGGNGGASLGAGFLFDAEGDDMYVAGHDGGNGGGALGGVGFLLDAAGNDVYIADRYGGNGAGYAGLGLLVDGGGGDDVYEGAHCGSNGGGHAGLGMLLDLGGNDTYRAGDIAANGGAFGGGVGLLWDEAGDDTYVAAGLGANGGSAGGLGLLLDRGGRDMYQDLEGGSGVDRTVVPKGALGAQVDS